MIQQNISYSPDKVLVASPVSVTINYTDRVNVGQIVKVRIWPNSIGKSAKEVTQTISTSVGAGQTSSLTFDFPEISSDNFIQGHWIEVELSGVGTCRTGDSTISTQSPPLGIEAASCEIRSQNTQYTKDSINMQVITKTYPGSGGYHLLLFFDPNKSILNSAKSGTVMRNLEIRDLIERAYWKPENKLPIKTWSFPIQDQTIDLSSDLKALDLNFGDYTLIGIATSRPLAPRVCSGMAVSFAISTVEPPPPAGTITSGTGPGPTSLVRKQCKSKDDPTFNKNTDAVCALAGGEPCDNKTGIKTAIGCIHTNPAEFAKDVLKFAIGIGGGLAFLMMLLGAFQMLTSQGNPESLKAGQDRLTSAVIGLLFVIFAVLFLQIIGANILGLPDFKP